MIEIRWIECISTNEGAVFIGKPGTAGGWFKLQTKQPFLPRLVASNVGMLAEDEQADWVDVPVVRA
jgi:hypothetical protein